MFDIRSLTELFSAPAAQGDSAPYALAFMSSTAVELVAVACLASALVFAAVRHLIRSSPIGDRLPRLLRRFDPLSLSKLIIPVTCLTMTVWIYLATQPV